MTTIQAIKKTDTEIKTDVLSELEYDPSVKVTDIGILVKDGTVTLNGFVTSYREKWEAVKVTLRGSVRNFAEQEEAGRVAWAAPGVFHVDNQLLLNRIAD